MHNSKYDMQYKKDLSLLKPSLTTFLINQQSKDSVDEKHFYL